MEALAGPGGFQNSLAAPPPATVLINGRSVYNCSKRADARSNTARCDTSDYAEVVLEPSKRYRFRFVQAGTHMQVRVSIDERTQRLIEIDHVALKGANVTEVRLHNGQRASTIIDSGSTEKGEVLWLRAALQTQCLGYQDPTANNVGRLRIRIKGRDGTIPRGEPQSKAWPSNGPAGCVDQDESELVPFEPSAVKPVTDSRHVAIFSNRFGVFNATGGPADFTDPGGYGAFKMNGITGRITPYSPMLDYFVKGKPIPKQLFATAIYPDDANDGVHLILNNLDAVLDHPYHLHNMAFTILRRGSGIMNTTTWEHMVKAGQLEPTGREVRRDTLVLPSVSWAL